MLDKIKNLDNLIEKIIKNGIELVGIGEFSHGTHECWKVKMDLIERLVEAKGEIDIFFEDTYPRTKNLDELINNKQKFQVGKDYKFRDEYPLKKYTSNRVYDCVEFLIFMDKLRNLNKNYKINIYGVDVLIQWSEEDLKQELLHKKKSIYEFYPEIKKDKSKLAKYIIKNQEKFSNGNKFMADTIKFIKNGSKRFGIFLGHNEHVVNEKIRNFKTTGYYLNEYYGDKYVSIGTASNGGEIRYGGERIPIFKLYEKPQTFPFIDRGSMARYIKVNYKGKKDQLVFKTTDETDLTIFSVGWAKVDDEDKYYIKNIKDFDYVIYLFKTIAVHNIII